MPTKNRLEKSILVLLLLITISLFSYWGYESVIFFLSRAFDVETNTTILDSITGIIALIASMLVIAGAGLRWVKHAFAKNLLIYGPIGFVIKNLFVIWNEFIVFRMTHATVTASDVEDLASSIGFDLFLVAFWVFIMAYFHFRIKKETNALAVSQAGSPALNA